MKERKRDLASILHQPPKTMPLPSIHKVATVCYTLETCEKGSLKHALTKQKGRADNDTSENEIIYKRSCNNLEDCLALATVI